MAYAHVQTKQQAPTQAAAINNASSISETFATTPAVGSLVIVYVSVGDPGFTGIGASSITDNQTPHNTWTLAKSQSNSDGLSFSVNVSVWFSIITTATGTFTVTANLPAVASPAIGISEFSGNHSVAASILDGTNSGLGSGTSPVSGGSVTPSQSGDLIISAVAQDNGSVTYTIPTGYDSKRCNSDGAAFQDLSSASLIKTDALSVGSTWGVTGSPVDWVVVIAAFKAASAGGGPRMLASLGVGN